MITSSYSQSAYYTGSIPNIADKSIPTTQSITPWSEITKYRSMDMMNPSGSESLQQISDGKIIYVPGNTASGANKHPWQGWTEASHTASSGDGGAVRTAILSGSYGQLKKLRVDSEVNSETVSTSWSASIGENLKVGNAAGVAGYLQVGDSGGLLPGAPNSASQITASKPTVNGIASTSLAVVKGNSVFSESLYVGKNASVSGSLDVKGNAKFASNLFVTGNAEITGNLGVQQNAQIKGDVAITGSADIRQNLHVTGSAGITGSLHVSGTANFHADVVGDHSASFEDVKARKNLLVESNSLFQGNVVIEKNLTVRGTASFTSEKDLIIADRIILVASGSTSQGTSDGAGLAIQTASAATVSAAEKAAARIQYRASDNHFTASVGFVAPSVTASYLQVTQTASIPNVHTTDLFSDLLVTNTASIQRAEVSVLDVAGSSSFANVSSSGTGQFLNVNVANKTTTKFETITGQAGQDALTINAGNIKAGSSNLLIQNITASNISASGIVSASFFSGDGSGIRNVTASIVTASAETASYQVTAGNEYTVYRFTHNLGTKNIVASVYQEVSNSGSVQIIPEQLAIVNESTIDIVFGRQATGYVVFTKAGHVLNPWDIYDPSEFINNRNIHWGTTGSWQAKEFTAVTQSGQIVKASEYVDAPKIGNRTTGPQTYTLNDWGSYILFKDGCVETYVKQTSASGVEPIIMSRQESNGDLKIRGSIITNATFTTSDLRYKKDIRAIDDALEAIKHIPGVRFTWEDTGEPGIGTIAQDVRAIYPELTKEVVDLNGNEKLTVDYQGLVGVLIAAVQQLSTKVEQLENQIKNNENR